jgi:AraC-like DNA-binding protein
VTAVNDDPQHIVSAARALLERYGFAVVQPNEKSHAEIVRESSEPLNAATPVVEWIDLFRATLVRSLQTGNASLGGLARQLLVSPRTLQRLLAAEGTSLRWEINLARRELATKLLQAGASNSVITLRLGYSDARALRRALRRWRAADDSANRIRGKRLR